MTDSRDEGGKGFRPFNEEQRRKLEEKVRRAREAKQEAEAKKDTPTDSATRVQMTAVENDERGAKDAQESASADSISPVIPVRPHAPAFNPIDATARDELRKQVEQKLAEKRHGGEVRKRLLSIAGKQARIDEQSRYNQLLLDGGQTWNSFEVTLIAGPAMTTPASVAQLWAGSPDYFKIVVGYALDAAGIWHPHAWLLAQGQVHEVTMKYAVYYGAPLSPPEAKRYAEMYKPRR